MAIGGYKQCKKIGCTNLTKETYCKDHMYIKEDQEKKWQRDYNKKRNYDNDKFYGTKGWKNKKEQISKRDNYLCQRCLHKFKLITPREAVHHVKPLKKYPQLRLRNHNLISLCDRCHKIVEGNKKENEYLQEIVDKKYKEDKEY